MHWWMFWEWRFDDPTVAGMLGGLTLGLGRLAMSLRVVANSNDPNKRWWNVIVGNLAATTLYMALGGLVSWGFQGRTGDFIAGLTALVTIVVISDKLMPSDSEAVMNLPLGLGDD
ncbi:hypothetical protein ANMWB30_23310 [Arthrobacter sp. MWB30]|nr:hypothetical protein ANMWB30_23310 [Arthrobacter sp. MWB30]